jgi:hypothetical protein
VFLHRLLTERKNNSPPCFFIGTREPIDPLHSLRVFQYNVDCSSVGSFGTARLGDEDFFIPGLCLAIDFFRFSLLLRNCLSALRGFLFPQARWKSIYYHSWVMGIARIATTTLDAVQKVIFLSSDVR